MVIKKVLKVGGVRAEKIGRKNRTNRGLFRWGYYKKSTCFLVVLYNLCPFLHHHHSDSNYLCNSIWIYFVPSAAPLGSWDKQDDKDDKF